MKQKIVEGPKSKTHSKVKDQKHVSIFSCYFFNITPR